MSPYDMRPNTLWKPQRNPEILVHTGEETRNSGLNCKWGRRPRKRLQRNPVRPLPRHMETGRS